MTDSVARRLHMARVYGPNKLSTVAIARLIEVSDQTIRQWEAGIGRGPRKGDRVLWSYYTGTPLSEIDPGITDIEIEYAPRDSNPEPADYATPGGCLLTNGKHAA